MYTDTVATIENASTGYKRVETYYGPIGKWTDANVTASERPFMIEGDVLTIKVYAA